MDLIDREALINAVEDLYEYAELGEALDVIKAAPTVEERPNGKWIKVMATPKNIDGYRCSNCFRDFHTKVPYFAEFNFCPNCGADMRGEKNG